MSSLQHYYSEEELMAKGEFIQRLEHAEWELVSAIGRVFDESGSAAYTAQVVHDRLREFMELKGVKQYASWNHEA